MRTNIVLDDQLVEQAMQLTGIRTKRALVEEALRTLVHSRQYEGRVARYMRLYEALKPRIARVRVSEPPSSLIRRMRNGPP
ncbi:MAG: type II toxin-antitoxin system VapB family antitoxin [Planctomycetes bacterium]|nr:type II toxin-antitoxin system VapB family antitoxin [Planctomycetota bacterium]